LLVEEHDGVDIECLVRVGQVILDRTGEVLLGCAQLLPGQPVLAAYLAAPLLQIQVLLVLIGRQLGSHPLLPEGLGVGRVGGGGSGPAAGLEGDVLLDLGVVEDDFVDGGGDEVAEEGLPVDLGALGTLLAVAVDDGGGVVVELAPLVGYGLGGAEFLDHGLGLVALPGFPPDLVLLEGLVGPLVALLRDFEVGGLHPGQQFGEVEFSDGEQVQLLCAILEVLLVDVEFGQQVAAEHDEAVAADVLDDGVDDLGAESGQFLLLQLHVVADAQHQSDHHQLERLLLDLRVLHDLLLVACHQVVGPVRQTHAVYQVLHHLVQQRLALHQLLLGAGREVLAVEEHDFGEAEQVGGSHELEFLEQLDPVLDGLPLEGPLVDGAHLHDVDDAGVEQTHILLQVLVGEGVGPVLVGALDLLELDVVLVLLKGEEGEVGWRGVLLRLALGLGVDLEELNQDVLAPLEVVGEEGDEFLDECGLVLVLFEEVAFKELVDGCGLGHVELEQVLLGEAVVAELVNEPLDPRQHCLVLALSYRTLTFFSDCLSSAMLCSA